MYYLDKDKNVIKCEISDVGRMMEDKDQIVKQDRLADNTFISTVFLPVDHRYWNDPGDPIVFETMIFDNEEYGEYQERYTSYDEALKRHNEIVKIVKSNKPLYHED